MQHFRLPDPGEGLVEAEIVSWKVAVGDEVKVNDIVVEIETSKSLVELPIPWAGLVTEIHVAEGQMAEVGTVIISIDDGRPGEAESAAPEPVLVGSGAKAAATSRRSRRGRGAGGSSGSESLDETHRLMADVYGQHAPSRRSDDVQEPHAVRAEPTGDPLPRPGQAPRGTDLVLVGGQREPLAKPPVRLLAKLLGVDLSTVTGTGPDGTITRGDVEAAAAWAELGSRPSARPQSSFVTDSAGDFGDDHVSSAYGPRNDRPWGERRVPIKGVRKVTAQAMVESVTKHVHVTEWTTVDVTRTMEMVETLRKRREFADLRVSPLLLYAKAVCLAMANNPDINSSWDEENQEIVYHGDVNLGIAAATPRGLMVPNIKGAQRMSLVELGRAITSLVQVSREGRLQPADYNGGTFTLTNVGVFGI
uniref:dihydrolipoamide acetyltransferase family protein n=1 Tax=Aestuariimicrobium ganziense TaxID=2773677 RepID=UPI001943E5E8